MATLVLQDASDGLADVQFGAANAGGDETPCGSEAAGWGICVVLLVKNDDVAAHDVTIDVPGAVDNIVVTVPASGLATIPVSQQIFGALAPVTYSAVTSVTVAAVSL